MAYGTADEALLTVLIMLKKMSNTLVAENSSFSILENKYNCKTGTSLIPKNFAV